MKNNGIVASCLLPLLLVAATSAQSAQTVVTFEDLGQNPITDGYGGISGWGDAGRVQENLYISGGQGNYSFGGFNTAPNDGVGLEGGTGGLHFVNGPVIFEGAYFYNADVPPSVDPGILLYFQGQLVHRIADPLASGLEWVASGYQGLVDTVYFAAGYDGYAIDNLTYSSPGSVSTVPEPGVPAMLVSGLALIGFCRRGRGNATSGT